MIIRDPLYNYLYLTKVERGILDNPLFQRLRHVSQNGVAYYTYPSNHSCRFLHSLGTMEVAGRMVSSLFLNSKREDVDELIRQCEDHVEGCEKRAAGLSLLLKDAKKHAVDGESRVVYAHFGLESSALERWVREGGGHGKPNGPWENEADRQFAMLVVFEAVRLAAMLHDLGHFPYSHALEDAFRQEEGSDLKAISEGFVEKYKALKHVDQLHEKVGIGLLDVVFPEDGLNPFERLCRVIARDVLESDAKSEGFVPLLHAIIASDLDADRLDYCMRDPRFSGMELGAFDLDRITSNFMLARDGGKLRVAASIRALPAIESFYHQRYLVYKYMIYHHGTVRVAELPKLIVRRLAELYLSGKPPLLRDFLVSRHFNYLWERTGEKEFFICTESWLFALMCDLAGDRCSYLEEAEEEREALEDLFLMIDTFTRRESSNFVTLTKRRNLYVKIIDLVKGKLDSQLLRQTEKSVAELMLAARTARGPSLFDPVKVEHGVTVMLVRTEPKTILNGEGTIDVRVVSKDGDMMPVADESPYLASLEGCVRKDQQFHLILFGDNVKSRPAGKLEEIKNDIADCLADAIEEQLKDGEDGQEGNENE